MHVASRLQARITRKGMNMSYVTTRQTFEAWLTKVDTILVSRCGVESADLPDCCYADWHEDGYTPSQAARKALRMADGNDE